MTQVTVISADEAAAAEAGADQIYTARGLGVVEMLAAEGLAVQGHLGLVPLFNDFRRLHDAGAYAVEVECVAAETLAALSARIPLVTHSIGSGSGGDVVFLFTNDICGEGPARPRHARSFGNLHRLHQQIAHERTAALDAFRSAVSDGSFPDTAHSIATNAGEYDKLLERLDACSADFAITHVWSHEKRRLETELPVRIHGFHRHSKMSIGMSSRRQ